MKTTHDPAVRTKPTTRKGEPTTCGRCDYDEAEGGLIDQCASCKRADNERTAGRRG